jgi:hypothetical protein
MPSYSGSQNVGDHGPIPPVGTKVWVEFEDDTQYFGHYLGAVQNDKTKIPEFTDKGKYAESYPQAYGSVDESGTLRASDNKRDWEEWTHVTGTNWQVDGMGNTSVTVNSLEKRQDNKEAKKQFSKGFSMSVFGDVTLYVKGKLSITVKGNIGITTKGDTSIATKGKTSIQTVKDTSIMTKGKTTIASEGDMQLSSKGKLDISASDKIALQAPQITSSVDITLSKGKDPAKVSAKADFKDPDDPKARSRPEIKKPEKPPEKENSTGADASGGAGGGAGGAGGAGGGGA